MARDLGVDVPVGKEAIREFLATKAPPVLDPFAHRIGWLAKSFIAQFIVLEEGEMFTLLEFQLIFGTVLLLRLMAPSLIRQRALSSNPDTDVPGQPGLQAQHKPA